jgi:hypothetical protein
MAIAVWDQRRLPVTLERRCFKFAARSSEAIDAIKLFSKVSRPALRAGNTTRPDRQGGLQIGSIASQRAFGLSALPATR